MKITIEGKRCEGKTTLALVIANKLIARGLCVEILEEGAPKMGEEPRRRRPENYVEDLPISPRNVLIYVKNTDERLWDGTITLDSSMKEAEEKHRKSDPSIYAKFTP